ncbi:hypothetical protein BN889_02357 [Pseudomonas aeruginosa PA38182]|nr:hypothetical protein BN889_02357 [Pseudomonas aeruginosa PA38182]
MFKDFDACTAWTDAMQERCQPVGLILYQPSGVARRYACCG